MITQRIANLRSLLRLISKPDFHVLYVEASNKKWLNQLIEQGSYEALKTWYKSKLNEHLGDKSVRELREIASVMAIPEYTKLKKSLLLAEIVKRREYEREPIASNNTDSQNDASANS